MAMTFLAAKQEVARSVGGASVTAQQTIAGQAIVDALRDLDMREHDWEYKLVTLSDITIVAGTATYSLTAPTTSVKRIHSARFKTSKRVLTNFRQRHVDRSVRDQETSDISIGYVEVVTASGVSLKLVQPPSQGDLMQVRVYETIDVSYADGDSLDVPDRYIGAVLALARYYFIINRDSEDTRAQTYLTKAEQLIKLMMNDDAHSPDEDIRIIPQDEWNFASGPDILLGGFDDGNW